MEDALSPVVSTGLAKTNTQLGKSRETPHDDDLTTLGLRVRVVCKYSLIDCQNLRVRQDHRRAISGLAGSVNEHLAKLTDEPHGELNQASLTVVVLDGVEHLGDRVLMQLRSRRDDRNDLRDVVLSSVSLRQGQDLNHCIDMPLLVGRVLLANLADLVSQLLLELVVGAQEVVEEFLGD